MSDAARDFLGSWEPEQFAKRFPQQNVTTFTTNTGSGKSGNVVRTMREVDFAQVELLRMSCWFFDVFPKKVVFHANDTEDARFLTHAARISSWYWPVAGVPGGNTMTPEVDAYLRSKMSVPYFFEKSAGAERIARKRIEFFFGRADSGVMPHTDPVCESIVSVQLEGRKRWFVSFDLFLSLSACRI